MPQRQKLIAGNWKMNGLRADGLALANAIGEQAAQFSGRAELLVCPPFTLIGEVVAALAGRPVAVGGQDCHAEASGAHTGDVSAQMLADVGARYVILGHSERRTHHGEADSTVLAKARAARLAGLRAIVCVGETLAEREAGRTLDVVGTQLAGSLPHDADSAAIIVAYEPVWAIGTGRVATPEQAQEVHAAIRKALGRRFGEQAAGGFQLLYGGSMKPDNAKELLALPDVDGGLIGGASLKAADFLAIAAGAT